MKRKFADGHHLTIFTPNWGNDGPKLHQRTHSFSPTEMLGMIRERYPQIDNAILENPDFIAQMDDAVLDDLAKGDGFETGLFVDEVEPDSSMTQDPTDLFFLPDEEEDYVMFEDDEFDPSGGSGLHSHE